MSYFPQPDPAKRAKRVKLGSSVKVGIRLDGASAIRAKLYELSATGGLLALSKPLEEGGFVEIEFDTSQGRVHAMAELLSPRRESSSGCFQPFRFIALDDQDHSRLRMALESLLDQTVVDVPTTKRPAR
jgi:hypothetical protein